MKFPGVLEELTRNWRGYMAAIKSHRRQHPSMRAMGRTYRPIGVTSPYMSRTVPADGLDLLG
jgi:hypothetical protein